MCTAASVGMDAKSGAGMRMILLYERARDVWACFLYPVNIVMALGAAGWAAHWNGWMGASS